MELARAPSIGGNGTWMWFGYEDLASVSADGLSFTLKNAAVAAALTPALSSPEGLWLHGYWKVDWSDSYVKILSITPGGGGYVFTRDNATAPDYGFTPGSRFYAVDALEFLDQPGEYYIDRVHGNLFFLPPAPLTPASDVMLSFLDTVVESSGAANTSFENMVVSIAKRTVVEISSGDSISVTNSTVSNAGAGCLSITGQNCSVTGNTVFGCGSTGISISSGDVATLAPGGSRVVGNHVTNFSLVVRTYQPGIRFAGVGLYVGNNTVEHGPHTAITGGGNDHLFEHNLIKRVCFECTDTGAFYVGRSWSQRGSVVRFNTFDTIRPTERLAQKGESQNAFYLDDQMSGYEFYNNTIINSTTGVLLGGGRRNTIRDNRFINNDRDIAFDDRGMTWQKNYCNYNCTDAKQGPQPACFRKELEGKNYKQPPYATRCVHGHGCIPRVPVPACQRCVN